MNAIHTKSSSVISAQASQLKMSHLSRSSSNTEWWHESVCRRTADRCAIDVQSIMAQSPFLQKPLPRNTGLAYLDRSEIRTGKLVGRGGYSLVYEIAGIELNPELSEQLLPEYQAVRREFAAQVVDPVTKRCRFVIKHLKEDFLTDREEFPRALSDLTLEAAYLSRFNHENILSLRGLPARGLDSMERHDGYFLILDRLEDTLEDTIAHIDDATKMEYARQLASALDYLHGNRILFRDLKPQNIGVDQNGRLKLFDFGLCREIPGDGDATNTVYEMSGVGTRRFMAPEIIRDLCYNTKADVYSWSLVVWQMFTNIKPYSNYDIPEHAKYVCYGGERPPMDNKIPLDLHSLLEQTWCESVEERCSISDVCRQLEELYTDSTMRSIATLAPTQTFVTEEGIEVTNALDDERDDTEVQIIKSCSSDARDEITASCSLVSETLVYESVDVIKSRPARDLNPFLAMFRTFYSSSPSLPPGLLTCNSGSSSDLSSSSIETYYPYPPQ